MKATSVVNRATISDVLRLDGVATIQARERIWFQCAVHADTHPSAVVVGKSGWRCFACGAKGGLLDLVVAFGHARTRADAATWLESRVRP